eukprot:403359915
MFNPNRSTSRNKVANAKNQFLETPGAFEYTSKRHSDIGLQNNRRYETSSNNNLHLHQTLQIFNQKAAAGQVSKKDRSQSPSKGNQGGLNQNPNNSTAIDGNLTSFQTYLIAKNSSPLSKMQANKLNEDSPNRYLQNQQKDEHPLMRPQQIEINTQNMINLTNQNIMSNLNMQKPQNLDTNYLSTQNKVLSDNQSQRSGPFYNNIPNQNLPHTSPLQSLKNLPEDYQRIIQEIEEKRTKSKNRTQPSQAPQATVLNNQGNIRLVSGLPFMAQPQLINQQPHQFNTQEAQIQYLEQLYQQQIMQQRQGNLMDPQTQILQQQINPLELQMMPSNLSGIQLLQFYQQKFNLLQQSQLQIQAQQQNLQQQFQQYQHVMNHQQDQGQIYQMQPGNQGYLDTLNTPQIIQNVVPPLQIQNIQSYQSPIKSSHKSNYVAVTPSPLGKPINFNPQRQPYSPINPKIQRNMDDLFSVINKDVLHDFESKKFIQIQQKYSQALHMSPNFGNNLQKQQFNSQLESHSYDRQYQRRTQFQSKGQAAQHVQKYLRGMLIRKRFLQFVKVYYFFKQIEKKFIVKDLVASMKDSFIQIKNIKTNLLKNYVHHCAIRIQKVFKGFYARRIVIKIKRAFRGKEKCLNASINAWRLRKIMKTKEVEQLTEQIKDFNIAMNDLVGDMSVAQRKIELQRSLEQSRFNAVNKLIGTIEKLQINGLWILYKTLEKRDRKQSDVSAFHQQQRDVFKVQRNRKALGTSFRGSMGSNGNVNSAPKKDGIGYLTIDNDQTFHNHKSSMQKTMMIGDLGLNSLQSTASFKNKQLTNLLNGSGFSHNPHNDLQNSRGVNDSLQSIEEILSQNISRRNLNAYNDVPLKSISKDFNSLTGNPFNMTNSRFQPNFHSEAYKSQAKEIFKRRMHYNPREAASKSRERNNFNNTNNTQNSPVRESPYKQQALQRQSPTRTVEEKKSSINFTQRNGNAQVNAQNRSPVSSQISTYKRDQRRGREDRKNSVKQDEQSPQQPSSPVNQSEERKFNRQGNTLTNDSKNNISNIKNSFTPESYSRANNRRTREERKKKEAEQLMDNRQVDPNINMFDNSQGSIQPYQSNQSSFKNIFKKNL